MGKTIEWMEQVYRLYSRKEADVFPIITHEFDGMKRNMDIKSGHLDGADIVGLKMLIRVRDNPEKRGLPNLTGLVLVSDSKTGQPIGLLDGLSITNMRTGASGGLAARSFARKDSKDAVVVGAGYQGRMQTLGLLEVMPGLEKVTFSDMAFEKAEELAAALREERPGILFGSCKMGELREKLASCDILVTCTNSKQAFIKKDWIKPGTHINAVGADMYEKAELEPGLLASAKIFADSVKQVTRLGECQHAYALGLIKDSDITEIGDVLEGKKAGRTSENEITVFDTTGMAIQDLIVGANLLKEEGYHNGES
jgi:ornithine cyclodeaminase/alanine dehydrogenase